MKTLDLALVGLSLILLGFGVILAASVVVDFNEVVGRPLGFAGIAIFAVGCLAFCSSFALDVYLENREQSKK